MIETAAQEISDIRSLLADPTPENFQEVTHKLANIASVLENIAAGNAPEPGSNDERAFLSGLPQELAVIRKIMEAPVKFYEGLQTLRAAKFGSYERTGALRSLEPQPSSTTFIHL